MSNLVVVGVDGSPHSVAALQWAIRHAATGHGEVMAVFCWQLPLIGIPGGYSRSEVEAAAKRVLNAVLAEYAPQPAAPVSQVVAEGDPTESLIEASRGASLLVLGIRGRSPFAGLMLGSVSQACAAHAACPVVLVKITDAPSGSSPSITGLSDPNDRCLG